MRHMHKIKILLPSLIRSARTQVAAVTEAKLEFNFGDSKADTIDKVIKAIDNLMYVGWVSSYIRPFKLVRNKVAPKSRHGSHQVMMMFITDGLDLSASVRREAKYLRDNKKFEVYAIGKIETLGSYLFTLGARVRFSLGINVNTLFFPASTPKLGQRARAAQVAGTLHTGCRVPATWVLGVHCI